MRTQASIGSAGYFDETKGYGEMDVEYVSETGKHTSASVDLVNGLICLSARCEKCKVEKEFDMPLRDFFDKLGITAKDCAKAFESEATDEAE